MVYAIRTICFYGRRGSGCCPSSTKNKTEAHMYLGLFLM